MKHFTLRAWSWLAVTVASVLAGPPGFAAEPAKAFALPGDGGWDYVTYDPSGARVLIGRPQGVQVVDAADGRLVATIGAPTGDHGAAPVPAADRIYTSDAKEHRLGVFILSTLRHLGSVPLPGEPDGLVTDTSTGRVFAFVPGVHRIVALDAATAAITGAVDTAGEPEAGVADGAGSLFVTLRDTGDVIRLDEAAMTVVARWRSGCERPSPIALDPASHRLFVGCRDRRLLVMDATDGHVVATVPIGETADAAAFDPRTRTVAVANGSGGITLIRAGEQDAYRVVGTIATPAGARTMALDPATGRLFTVTADIASVEPPTAERPYPRLHPRPGTFRLLVVGIAPG